MLTREREQSMPQHQRFSRHFQAEHTDRQFLIDGHMLAMSWPARFSTDGLAAMTIISSGVQPGGHFVEVREPSAQAGERSLALMVSSIAPIAFFTNSLMVVVRIALRASLMRRRPVPPRPQRIHFAFRNRKLCRPLQCRPDQFFAAETFLNDLEI